MSAILIRIDGYDPVASASVEINLSSRNDERVCHLDGRTWWPVIAELPSLRYDLIDGGMSGRIDTPGSQIALGTEPWPNFARYALADARIRIWSGEPGQAWGDWVQRFDGRVTAQPNVEDGRASLPFAVDDRWLDAPLLATYAGTGGAEGEAAIKGNAKPLSLGAPRFVPGMLIDSIDTILQLSAYGEIESVEMAFERLSRFGASAGNHASFAALDAAAIVPGSWATARAAGLVRHGAPPAGKLSYHVRGDKAGPDGWVRLPGALIKRIALLAGGTGKIHEASIAALDSARPYNQSLHVADQVTARELIQRIAASVNAVAGVTWMGQLFVAPIPTLPGSASLTLDATGASLPPVRSIAQVAMDAPYWRLAIEAERTWDVHGFQEVAFTATLGTPRDYNATTVNREGDIVLNQGSTWLYIAATPSAGNAPPTLPSPSNTWWRALALGGVDGEDGDDAPDVILQFSVNGSSGWHNGFVTGDRYWRQSTDGGSTFTASQQLSATTLAELDAVAAAKLTGIEAGADVTANSQVVVVAPPPQEVATDYQGAVKADELPRILTPQVTKGGADIRTANGTSYAIVATGVTASVNNTNGSADKGRITLTAGTTGRIDLTVTVGGVAQPPVEIPITAKADAAPVPSGGGGGGGTAGAPASTSSFSHVTSTSHASIIGKLTVVIGSAGTAQLRWSGGFYATSGAPGSHSMSAKWRRSQNADMSGAVDCQTEVGAQSPAESASSDNGYRAVAGAMVCNVDVSGLSAGTWYFDLQGRRSSGSANLSPYKPASVTPT